jgi:crotonobetainyl-CoA:carnitine CoA-transferase CaiB-like acyl-CoA transferase
LSRHDKFEVVELAQELRLPFAEVLDIREVLHDPQHEARGYVFEVDHPVSGPSTQPGFLFQASGTPWQTSRAPLLGEHNLDVYGDLLGYETADLRVLRERGII